MARLVPWRDDAVASVGVSSFKAQTVLRALRDYQIEIDSGARTLAGAWM